MHITYYMYVVCRKGQTHSLSCLPDQKGVGHAVQIFACPARVRLRLARMDILQFVHRKQKALHVFCAFRHLFMDTSFLSYGRESETCGLNSALRWRLSKIVPRVEDEVLQSGTIERMSSIKQKKEHVQPPCHYHKANGSPPTIPTMLKT